MRKIIQIANIMYGDSGYKHFFALCDDGSLWIMDNNQQWIRFNNVPQD